MVRNYKPKTERGSIDENAMNKAVSDILRGVETPTSASLKYNLKRQTIQSRLEKVDPLEDIASDQPTVNLKYQSKYTSKQVFTKDEELELVDYIKKCASYQFGLTYKIFQRLAYEYAKVNGKNFPQKWEDTREAGIDWRYGFMKRHPTLTLRKPERTSLARITGFTKKAVDDFYENLKDLYKTHSFQPKDIYNLDETGITTVVDTPKVIAAKGQRQVGQAVSAERGSLVTLVGIINASGIRLPPVYVFPRQRYKTEFLNGCVPGSLGLISKSGWMISELFIDVLKHIQRNTNCSKERPILLILDNHSSHCSIESINFSRENGIHLLSFPPHTSHRLQPLDVSVYGPFKKYLQVSFNDFMTNNPGERITIYHVARLSNIPFLRAFSSENIINGFASTGIYPLNSQNFNEAEFLAEEQSRASEAEKDNNPCANISPIREQISHDELDNNPCEDISPLSPNLTPDQIRPISRLSVVRKTTKCGSSKILTSSAEKRKIEEKQLEKNSILAKKVRKNLVSSKTKLVKKIACKKTICVEKKQALEESKSRIVKNSKCKNKNQDSKNKKPKVKDRRLTFSSDESDISNISYADTEKSLGHFAEIEEKNETLEHESTEDTDFMVGDYVLVKLAQHCKRKIYYVAEIIEALGDCTFTVNFFRKLENFSSLFIKPENEDISLILRSEIELKLLSPSNLPSSSRSRPKYLFEVDLSSYFIK